MRRFPLNSSLLAGSCAVLAASALVLAGCEAPREAPIAVRAPAAAQITPPPRPQRLQRAEAAPALERLGIAVRPGPHGVTVVAIDLDGPAAQSGALVGDVVIAVNGSPVASAAELDRAASAAPGGAVVLEVMRGAEHRQVAIGASTAAQGAWNPLGLQVREVPRDTLNALGVAYGIMVMRVRAPADRTRILPGDVIVGVNHTNIRSMEDFNRLVAQANSAVALLVRRADSDLYIAFDVGAGPHGGASRGGGAPPAEPFRTQRDATGKPLRT